MMKKKRILAAAAAVILVLCFVFAAIVPAFAAVDWELCLYISDKDEGGVPSPYSSWSTLLFDYYTLSNGTSYYFEVRNTELGGTQYVPTSYQFGLAYGAYQTGWGYVDLVYRFYVPKYPSNQGWDFQIRTSTGLIAFDSTNSTFYESELYSNVGFYEFTLDRTLTGFSGGWYIYSAIQPPLPLGVDDRNYNIQFQYYNSSNQFLGSKILYQPGSTNIVDVFVPSLPNYIISSVDGPGIYDSSDGSFRFPNGILSDIVVTVNCYSYQEAIDDAYNRGFDRGRSEGLSEGIQQGYENYKSSPMYREEIQAAYDRGWDAAVESGQTELKPLTNPLLWVTAPVVSFMNIDLYPGLSIGVLFLAAVAVSLVVIFLKIFSGG